MKRLIIVSNRLPMNISRQNNELDFTPAIGGLATGMKSVYKRVDSLWIGWSGIERDQLRDKDMEEFNSVMKEEKCHPIFIEKNLIDQYYYGFSNQTIWPLFHYFPQFTKYDKSQWLSYEKVNRIFADEIIKIANDDDLIWIHDYHLLLVPGMVKEKLPGSSIGFFLHIPFPSYELFRLLPWRDGILSGLLGADLIGFHTYDYMRHFSSCARRLKGYDVVFNKVNMETRQVQVDIFPMGIDYNKFNKEASKKLEEESKAGKSEISELTHFIQSQPDRKLILSIDRLDYSKGISNRLWAFDQFLESYPQHREKVSFIMLANPTRENVEQYQIMKSEVDELVGRINGKYGTVNWTPIRYFYRTMPFENLVDLYHNSDIALITPIRDGMNLVAKEYIASKPQGKGVLIISEMAGSAREMSEALIVNPNNSDEIAAAIDKALSMPGEEQVSRIRAMQKRLKRYDIMKWSDDFLSELDKVSEIRREYLAKKLTPEIENKLAVSFKSAKSKRLILDLDDKLLSLKSDDQSRQIEQELHDLLNQVRKEKESHVLILSSGTRNDIPGILKKTKLDIITEDGLWLKEGAKDWSVYESATLSQEWKEVLEPLVQIYVDRTPGSFIEERAYALVWNYEKVDPELGKLRAMELKDEMTTLVANLELEIVEGPKFIEIRNIYISKGKAGLRYIREHPVDFNLALGDQRTDEFLFEQLPKDSVSIKIGVYGTHADYNCELKVSVPELIQRLTT